MSFEKEIEDFEAIIEPLFDEEKAKELSSFDLTSIHANLTYAVGNINSIGMKEMEEATKARRAKIEKELKRVEELSARVFTIIDEMQGDPRRASAVYTGTRPKESVDIPPTPRPERAGLSLPLSLEQPEWSEQRDIPVDPIVGTGVPTAINNDVLQNVIAQLKDEFQRLFEGANRPATVHSSSPRRSEAVAESDAPSEESFTENIVGVKRKDKSPTPVVRPKIDLKLDRFTLPAFSGTLTEWIAFRDQYLDLIHENPEITPIMKFYQLRSYLSGKALDVINGFQISAADYEAAWNALRQRYDNKNQIINEYIKKVLHLPCLEKNPSKEKLLNIVDRTNQMLRVLPHFGLHVHDWDPILMVILLEKLDPSTERKWLEQVKRRERVHISEFFEFLEQQAAEIAAMARSSRPPTGTGKNVPRKPVLMLATEKEPQPVKEAKGGEKQATAKGKEREAKGIPLSRTACPHPKCDQFHPPYRCQKFLNLPRSEREECVKKANLCVWCLNLHKAGKKCTFGVCRLCKGEHNMLLCTEQVEEDVKSPSNA